MGVCFGAVPFVGGVCGFLFGGVAAGLIPVGSLHCIGLLIRLKQRWPDEDYA